MRTVRLAIRNVSRQRRRSVLIGGAVGFGFVVITLVNGLTGGVMASLKANFADLAGGHVFVAGEEKLPSGRTGEIIREPKVVEDLVVSVLPRGTVVSRRSRSVADAISGSRTVRQVIDGVDFDAERRLLDSILVVDGNPFDILAAENGMILPRSTAEALRVVVGEIVTLRLSTVSGQTNVGDVVVVATFEDPAALGIGRAYMHLSELNELAGVPRGGYQSITIGLANPRRMPSVANNVRTALRESFVVVEQQTGIGSLSFAGFSLSASSDEEWSGIRYRVTTLDDVLSQILALISVVDAISLGVYIALLAITMIGVANSFRMVVLERSSEIGTMRALGMQRPAVRQLFLLEAVITTTAGVIGGALVAAVVILVVRSIPVDLPGIQFLLRDGHVAFRTSIWSVSRNVAIVVGLGLIAAVRPASQAAAVEPAEALRTTV